MTRLIAAVLILVLGGAAMAQHDPKAKKDDGPEPADFMKDAVKAMEEINSFTIKIETRGVGAQALRTPEMSATVVATRAPKKDPLGWKFRLDGKAVAPGAAHDVLAAYDGKTVRSLRVADRKVIESAADNAAEVLDDGTAVALSWLLRWNELARAPFNDPEKYPIRRYDGTALVGGVKCDVVYVDYSETSDPNLFDAWWYLGVDDHLPRRVDMHLSSNRFGEGFTSVKLTDLHAGGKIEDALLAFKIPDGFELVKAKEKEEQPGLGRAVKASTLAVGEKAPDWELEDPQGKKHKLSDYAGKVVVMDFWATWCGPCQMAMPGIQKVHEAFKGQPVQVFGIDCWESGDPVAMMKDKGFTYGLLLKGDPVAKDYGVSGIPTFYVIGKDGRIAHASVGFNPAGDEKLTEVIKAELAKNAAQ